MWLMNMLYQRGTGYMMPGHQWNNSLQVNGKQITAYMFVLKQLYFVYSVVKIIKFYLKDRDICWSVMM